jgi:hypothetical protein
VPAFVFVYRAPQGFSFEPEMAADWNDWFESIGSQLTDVGQPVTDRSVLGNGPTDTILHGFSFVEAEDLQSAVELAEGCPFIKLGGGIEVGEVTPPPPRSTQTAHARAQVA